MLMEKQKRQGYESLYYFAKYIIGFSDMERDPHLEVCDFIQRNIFRRDILLLLPRGTYKSSITSVALPLWLWLRERNLRILLSSAELPNTKGFLGLIRQNLELNNTFRALYGHWDDNNGGVWHSTALSLAGRTERKVENSVTATSVDVSKVSQHYDLAILDDLATDKNSKTKELRDQVEAYNNLLIPILDPIEGHRNRVWVGTRWDYDDIYGRMLARHAKAKAEGRPTNLAVMVAKARWQERGVTRLFFPKVLSNEFLDNLAADGSMTPYQISCNPAEAPVLMADWTFKPISEVRIGDKLIGFEKGNGHGSQRRFVVSEVLATRSRIAPVQRVFLDSGEHIRCTPDHEWFTGRVRQKRREYSPAKVGSKLMRAVDLPKEWTLQEWKDWSYLAGIVDGEGCCKGSCVQVIQSPTKNPSVTQKIREVLERLGIEYSTWHNPVSGGGQVKSDSVTYTLNGSRDLKLNLIRAGLAKKNQLTERLNQVGGKPIKRKERVTAIQPEGRERVYSMQTTSGNYVVWGLLSKNCNYYNDPVSDATAIFKLSEVGFFSVGKDGGQRRRDPLIVEGEQLGDSLGRRKVEPLPQILNFFTVLDPAVGDSDDSCNSAFVTVGVDAEWNMYVWDVRAKRLSSDPLIREMFDVHRTYNPIAFGVEAVSFQKYILWGFRQACRDRNEFFQIRELTPDSDLTKDMRISGFQYFWRRRKVFLRVEEGVDLNLAPEHLAQFLMTGQELLLDEAIHFPRTATKDCIDALAYMPQIIFPAGVPREKDVPPEGSAEAFERMVDRWTDRPTALRTR